MSTPDETNQTQYDFFSSSDAGAGADESSAVPTVSTDLADYSPGATAIITASGYDIGETIDFQVVHVVDAGTDGVWGTGDDILGDNTGSGHESWSVTDGVRQVDAGADGIEGTPDDVVSGDLDGVANGTVVTTWYVNPDDSLGATFRLTADGDAGNSASTSFTDNLSLSLKQWANGPAPSGMSADDGWQNGNLNDTKAHFSEGDSVPYRAVIQDLSDNGFYTFRIGYDTIVNGKHALDYLTSFDRSYGGAGETVPDPLLAENQFNPATVFNQVQTLAIPTDPNAVNQIAGNLTFYGGVNFLGFVTWGNDGNWNTAADNQLVTAGSNGIWGDGEDVHVVAGADGKFGAGDVTFQGAANPYMVEVKNQGGNTTTTTYLAPYFQYVGGNSGSIDSLVVAWGGHIATQTDWGAGNSATAISGSPYHTFNGGIVGYTDGAGVQGSQDAQLSAGAVSNPNLSITKTATVPGGTADTVGELITYSITVQNTGDVALTNVALTDQVEGGTIDTLTTHTGDTTNPGVLDVGETWVYTTTYAVTPMDINSNGGSDGQIHNVATVDTLQTDPKSATADVPVAQTKSLSITKTAMITGDADGKVDSPSDDVTYTIAVTNTGNTALTGVTLTDQVEAGSIDSLTSHTDTGAGTHGDNVLDPGETWTYTTTFDVTQALIDSNGNGDGKIHNVATVDTDQTTPQSATADVDIVPAPAIDLTKTNAGVSDVDGNGQDAGDQITYTYAVQNTGNITLLNVSVSDDKLGAITLTSGLTDADGDGSADDLAVGAIVTGTATATLTQAQLDAGSVTNLATASGTPPTGSNVTDTDTNTVPVTQTPAIDLTKTNGGISDLDANGQDAGDQITYTYAVQNTGNVTLFNIAVSDDKLGTITLTSGLTDADGDGQVDDLAVGATATGIATATLAQAQIDAGSVTNLATASDTPPTGSNVTDTDTNTVPISQTPAIDLTKTNGGISDLDGNGQDAGDQITYTYAVQNIGNVTLFNVAVSDDKLGAITLTSGLIDADGDGSADDLAVGAIATGTASATLTQGQVDAGSVANLATATGTPPTGANVTDTDTNTVPVTQAPAIDLTKTNGGVSDIDANGQDAGDQITYTYAVQNTGNVTLFNVAVSDDKLGAITLTSGLTDADGDGSADDLAVGATATGTATATLTQGQVDAGAVTNLATASGTPPTGSNVADTDTNTVPISQTPAIDLTKTNGGISDLDGNGQDAGDQITYTYAVQNTGNVTLFNVAVSDDKLGSITLTSGLTDADGDGQVDDLAVGAAATGTATATLTQAQIDAGSVTNLATASGTPPTGSNVTDTDTNTVPVTQTPAIDLTKTNGGVSDIDANGQDAGDQITYTYAVQNTGNVTLFNVAVSDDKLGAITLTSGLTDADGDGSVDDLAVGATATGTATATLSQGQIDAGSVTNLATASGTPPAGSNVTDTDTNTVPIIQDPKLTIEKSVISITNPNNTGGGSVVDQAGDVVAYAIVVTNTGNVTLTNVALADALLQGANGTLGSPAGDDGNAVLDVGEIWTYTGTYTVQQSDIDNQGAIDGTADNNIHNVATVDTQQTDPLSDSADVPIDRTVDLFGHKFGDLNGNGTWDKGQGEGGLGDWTVQLHEDTNHSGQLDAGDALVASTTTGADGAYLFDDVAVAGHTYFLTEVLQDGWKQTAPSGGTFTVPVDTGSQIFDAFDFGNQMITGPGVRTPGFWSNNGAPFWDAKADNGKHAGDPCFPGGELVYQVDSNKSGAIDGADKAGVLIGDYNRNGLIDAGEDTFFIALADAQKIINASQKDQQDGRWMLARDAVASWLNYLAGNPIGTVDPSDGAYSPREGLNDAIDWLQVTTGGNNTTTFGNWPGGGASIKQNSAAWNTGLETEAARAGVEPGGNYIHQQLDEYNNTGSIDGTFYAFDGDNCGADQHFVQYATMLKSAEDLHLL
ncbi:DUF11 domain-containing protein [Reyranella sp. CPCC 100927]|uniref:DUF7507 domain-containing protein n=1 Tax=Reyranella sp. CPCC 100927 TaxID=2599616 RepID=UPI0011B49C93|nr:DUF11 domain-containing protein [Reyranella sp. CPCC 100927]TWT13897.1 hypothetical protein FQU96_08300 [Reyranella sp. CPCC 100927]